MQGSSGVSSTLRLLGFIATTLESGLPAFAGDDVTDPIFKQPHHSQTQLRDLAAHVREFCCENPALCIEKAQGMPGARCARSRAWCVVNTRVSHHGHTEITRHSLRNGFNGFLRALPGDRACLPPSSAELLPPT